MTKIAINPFHDVKKFWRSYCSSVECYFNDQFFLTCNQYGYRSKHSTEYGTLEIINRTLIAHDKNECPVHVYLDLAKAFGTIDHNIYLNNCSVKELNALRAF